MLSLFNLIIVAILVLVAYDTFFGKGNLKKQVVLVVTEIKNLVKELKATLNLAHERLTALEKQVESLKSAHVTAINDIPGQIETVVNQKVQDLPDQIVKNIQDNIVLNKTATKAKITPAVKSKHNLPVPKHR